MRWEKKKKKKYEKQFNNNNDADDKINYAQGWWMRKKKEEAFSAVAHLIWFPDAGGYQVPIDKQTQWVCTAKSLHGHGVRVRARVCVYKHQRVILKKSACYKSLKQHTG